MRKEIDLKQITNVLKEQLKITIDIKNELINLEINEKAALFRDYEKKIENHLELIQKKDGAIIPHLIDKKPFSKIHFSNESMKLLKTVEKKNTIIFTNDLAINILKNSKNISKMIISYDILLDSLTQSIIENDMKSKNFPQFSIKSIKAIRSSFLETKLTKESKVSSLTILLCILRNEMDLTTIILNKHGLTYEKLFNYIKKKPTYNTV